MKSLLSLTTTLVVTLLTLFAFGMAIYCWGMMVAALVKGALQ